MSWEGELTLGWPPSVSNRSTRDGWGCHIIGSSWLTKPESLGATALPHLGFLELCLLPFLGENARENSEFGDQKPEPKPYPPKYPSSFHPPPHPAKHVFQASWSAPDSAYPTQLKRQTALQVPPTAEAAASPTPARLPSSSPSPSPWRPAPGSAPSTGEQHHNGTGRASSDTGPAANHDAHRRGAAASGTDARNSPGPREIHGRAAQRWVLYCPFCGAVQAAYVNKCHGDRLERKG